jgi:hypothetical protein
MMGFGGRDRGGRGSKVAALLSLLAWIHLAAALGGAAFVWDSHQRNREVALGAYRVAWAAVSGPTLLLVIAVIVLQGLLVFAVLQGLASMTADLRAIRGAGLPAAGVARGEAPLVPEAGATAPERLIRCDECGREFPEAEIVRHLGRNVCRVDYERWLRGS